ncbi:MAG: hypothetical protein AAF497_22640, partial [Planctomycetota bacterium]
RDFSKGATYTAGQLDLIEAYGSNELGKILPFAFTEYGSWNRTNRSDGTYGDYTRPQQQWDLTRDVREKMMVFLNRPDRVLSATPFVSPRHWEGGVPTNAAGDNVFFEQDASGNWSETIVGNMFRMLAPVSGRYIDVAVDNPDLQTVAFRDGNQVFIVLNNLQSSNQTVSLSGLGLGNVQSASLDRIRMVGSTPTFDDDLDVSGSWQHLVLSGEEGAVLSLTLDSSSLFDRASDTITTYGSHTADPITQPGGRSTAMNLQAELQDATSAKLRVSYSRPGQNVEAFDVILNGTRLWFSADELAGDDGAFEFISREIEVPLNLLQEGNNTVQADFSGNGGRIGAIVLEVTRSIGEFDGDGTFGCGDIDAIVAAIGTGNDRFDLTGDGVIDVADVQFWISDLRNAPLGDLNFDGSIDISDFDLFLDGFLSDYSGMDACVAYQNGDLNFDGVSTHLDFVAFRDAYDSVHGDGAFAALVPEPSTVHLAVFSAILMILRLRRRSMLAA